MAKTISASGAGAVRTILKNKEDFHYDLISETPDGDRTTYVYDIFYENVTGRFTIARENGKIIVAALNLSIGKVISLVNDANIRKLAEYVLDNPKG